MYHLNKFSQISQKHSFFLFSLFRPIPADLAVPERNRRAVDGVSIAVDALPCDDEGSGGRVFHGPFGGVSPPRAIAYGPRPGPLGRPGRRDDRRDDPGAASAAGSAARGGEEAGGPDDGAGCRWAGSGPGIRRLRESGAEGEPGSSGSDVK